MKEQRNGKPGQEERREKPNLRWVLELILALAFVLYTAFRFAAIFGGMFKVLFPVFGALGVFLLAFQAITTLGRGRYSALYSALVFLSGLYIAFLVYSGCGLLVFDALYAILAFGFHLPVSPALLTGLAALTGVLVTLYGAVHAARPVVVPVRVPTAKVKTPYRVVQLSDLHIGAVIGRRRIASVVRQVSGLCPDLVVITGDLFNRRSCRECRDLHLVERELSSLSCPVVCVTGNHDLSGSDPDFSSFLSRSGILLVDEKEEDFGPVRVIGRSGCREEMENRRPLPDLSGDARLTIVLDHNPKGMEEAAFAGADLALFGHTHAGQFFPCTLMTRWYYGKAANHGVSKDRNTTCIVSSGTGCFQCPVRVGTNAEIVRIDVYPV